MEEVSNIQVTVRLPVSAVEEIKALAESKHLSFTPYLRQLLLTALDKELGRENKPFLMAAEPNEKYQPKSK
jgi:hypothetical protein